MLIVARRMDKQGLDFGPCVATWLWQNFSALTARLARVRMPPASSRRCTHRFPGGPSSFPTRTT